MFDLFGEKEKYRYIARWIIGTVTACILVFLGIRHIHIVAMAVSWVVNLCKPLLIGLIIALILNVPMRGLEETLLSKMHKGRRPLAIVLALVLVLGLFVGIAVLVIPELVDAIALLIQIVMDGIDKLAQIENSVDLSQIPFGTQLAAIDWMKLKVQLEEWLRNQGGDLVGQAVGAIGSAVSLVITGFVALFFSIYVLAQKEALGRQVKRLMHVWLPKRFTNTALHIAGVCGDVFRNFVAGQAIEAIILGSLCTIGMLILRLPYAPMIGALVGVTALIPVVGAYVGCIIGAIMILTVSPLKALIFVVFLVILQQLEGNLIYPKVVGSRINLPAIWVLAAVTVGGNLAGPVGMLLGVPAASSAYALLKEATNAREQRRINESNCE